MQIASRAMDELDYLPFSATGGALLFHLLSKLYERTSTIITWTCHDLMPLQVLIYAA